MLEWAGEIQYLAQLDYLREVQRSFAVSGTPENMWRVFGAILAVAVPLVSVAAFWWYRSYLFFLFSRFMAEVTSRRSRTIIETFLVRQGMLLEVFLFDKGVVGRRVCLARASRVKDGRMELELSKVEPTALKLQRRRVICFTKPFTYSRKKYNCFTTFVSLMQRRGTRIVRLSLYTPAGYRFVVRRRHPRHRIFKQELIRVKAWSGTKRHEYRMVRPELQTVADPTLHLDKTRLQVYNISPGGIRLLVLNPKAPLPPLSVGSELVLRISIWNPTVRKYTYFAVLGVVRSRFKAKQGGIGLGIQFVSVEERSRESTYWRPVKEVEALVPFLQRLKEGI